MGENIHAINPVGLNYKVPNRDKQKPIYEITLNSKKNETFIAASLDKTAYGAEVIGIFGSVPDGMSPYDFLNDKSNFIELVIPWHKISIVKNLTYKK